MAYPGHPHLSIVHPSGWSLGCGGVHRGEAGDPVKQSPDVRTSLPLQRGGFTGVQRGAGKGLAGE